MTYLQGEWGRRVIENKHWNRPRSMAYLQGECSYRHAGSLRRFNVGRVLVLNDPPARCASLSKYTAWVERRSGRREVRVSQQ